LLFSIFLLAHSLGCTSQFLVFPFDQLTSLMPHLFSLTVKKDLKMLEEQHHLEETCLKKKKCTEQHEALEAKLHQLIYQHGQECAELG